MVINLIPIEISHDCIVKGDNKFMNIAAINYAKTRDELMKKLSEKHPEFFGIKIKDIPQKSIEGILNMGNQNIPKKFYSFNYLRSSTTTLFFETSTTPPSILKTLHFHLK